MIGVVSVISEILWTASPTSPARPVCRSPGFLQIGSLVGGTLAAVISELSNGGERQESAECAIAEVDSIAQFRDLTSLGVIRVSSAKETSDNYR